ncbi:effector-associated constant component EACC1 [Streptomyces sp. NPDC000851]
MIFRIKIDGADAEDELRSLRAWLEVSPQIRQHATIAWHTEPTTPGHMSGGAMEWLQFITDNAWSAANFTVAYITWRRTRRNPRTAVIETNGVRVSIEGADAEVTARIAEALSSNG